MSSEKSFNLKIKILLFLVFVLIISHYFSFTCQEKKIEGIRVDINSYLSRAYNIERKFIENIPIYRDFATPAKEQELRKHLLMDHIHAAERYGIKPVTDDSGISGSAQNGKLVNIEEPKNRLYYFHNVRKKYRYLTKNALKGLQLLTERLQENLKKRADLPPVKIALSSVIRPASYQKKLMQRNMNASFISTHSYGTSFDIFYDNYFVSVPLQEVSNKISEDMLNRMRTRIGYMMGEALRRQLRSILMDTLIELQDQGKLYAILEKRQRCYHVTILN